MKLCYVVVVLAAILPVHAQEAKEPSAGVDASAAPSASSDETFDLADAHAGEFRVEVRGLFDRGAYSQIDALAAQARSQKLRFRGGAWKLNALYGTLGTPGALTSTDAEWRSRMTRLEDWITASPASPTPRVALAHAYVRFAWKARGNGQANTVTKEGWTLFFQRIQSARTVLDDAAAAGARDPQWYREMQTVALAQGWDRGQVDALAKEALDNEPGYFYFGAAQTNYLLPKWYGKPGEAEQYAQQVADQAGGAEGDAEYFQIAAEINCCRHTQAPALSWARVQKGFTALSQLYGATNHQRNVMAYLAVRAGDTETAQQLFERIGNNWDENVWRSKALFDASRTGQPVGGVKPLRVDGPGTRTSSANE